MYELFDAKSGKSYGFFPTLADARAERDRSLVRCWEILSLGWIVDYGTMTKAQFDRLREEAAERIIAMTNNEFRAHIAGMLTNREG